MTKILLTGRNGQVGWELERRLAAFGEVVATDRTTLNLEDPATIRRVVREAKPDIIVNAGAYTAVDRAESDAATAMRINAAAPGVLAEEAKRLGALLVHYSTDYVFDGRKASPYRESDAPGPLSVYGRSKLEGERAIQAAQCRHVILRTSWVYAPRGRNFILAIAGKARAGEDLRVVDDQRGVPNSAAFIARMTRHVLDRRETASLYHLSAAGETTWYDLAREIVGRLRLGVRITPIGTGEYPAAAARPPYGILDARKLATDLAVEMPPWQALLEECLAEM